MGGNPPVGYEIKDRKLVINKDGPKAALHLFERYKDTGCVSGLKKELDRSHVLSRKRRTAKGNSVGGGLQPWRAVRHTSKPIYIGKIRHKDKIYEGQHEAIIPEYLWNDVQELLKNGGAPIRGISKPQQTNLLKGILFDCDRGTRYSPVRAKKERRKPTVIISAKTFCNSVTIPKALCPACPRTNLNKKLAKLYAKMFPIFWILIDRKTTT